MKNIVLFDMDGTLTKPRKAMESNIIPALRELAKHAEIGIVTGSDYIYVHQQIGMLLERSELRYRIHILPCNGTKYYPPPDSANSEYRLAHQVNMREELGEVRRIRDELTDNATFFLPKSVHRSNLFGWGIYPFL